MPWCTSPTSGAGDRPPAVTFNTNMAMNFNVFHAAARCGLQRVVWASSETTLGLPFTTTNGLPPRYAPVDEDHYPVPTSTYALSKVASETVAAHVAQWSSIPFVALRFSNIMDPDDYAAFPSMWADPHVREWNLWATSDGRDVAAACRRSHGTVRGARRQPGTDHRGRGHGHEPSVGGTLSRGVPRSTGHPGRRRVRDVALNRPRPRNNRLRAPSLVARSPRRGPDCTSRPFRLTFSTTNK